MILDLSFGDVTAQVGAVNGLPKTIDAAHFLKSTSGAGLAPLLATANAVQIARSSMMNFVCPMTTVALGYAWLLVRAHFAWRLAETAVLIQIAVLVFVLVAPARL